MTTAAKTLRAALKTTLGLTSHDVSVRTTRGTGSLTVEIKKPDAPFAEIERIAKEFERVDRCEVTHEILSGANTFVTVSWSYDAKAARAERYADAVKAAAEKLDSRHGVGVPVGDTGVMLWMSDFGGFEVAGESSRPVHGGGVERTAAAVADLVDASAVAVA